MTCEACQHNEAVFFSASTEEGMTLFLQLHQVWKPVAGPHLSNACRIWPSEQLCCLQFCHSKPVGCDKPQA